MANSVTSRQDEERRPLAVLFVYTWDLVLGLLALFGALAPFAGGVSSGTGVKPLPIAAQVVAAVSSASYAATLFIIAMLLTRRRAWVRQTQIGTLGAAIALAIVSVIVGAVSGSSVDIVAVLVTLLFVILDALGIIVMTERRVARWYDERSRVPVYVWITLGLWVAGSAMIIVIDATIH